jgi:hypothetical protein
VVIPWFLVFVLSAAAFVWITTGLALVFRLRKPVSAYLERTPGSPLVPVVAENLFSETRHP